MENEAIINEPFSKVWDALVRELAKSFFVINNVEKESRIINVSFSTQSPQDYVDCGRTYRVFKQGDEEQNFDYTVAGSSSYKYAYRWGPYKNLPAFGVVARKTSLEGRINIYVAPFDADASTQIVVNTRYILTANTSGTYFAKNAFGAIADTGAIPPNTVTVSFNTKELGLADFGSPAQPDVVTCQSTGKLEAELLNLVRKP